MNELTVFRFKESQEVRTLERDGALWFVAKDVCDAVGHSNSRIAIEMLDDDEKGVSKVYTLGGEQEMNIINESGLYNLIFRSNKPEARAFRKWVTSEVLPAIRKQGFYALKKRNLKLRKLNKEIEQSWCEMNVKVGELERRLEDPKVTAKADLRRYIMNRMVSTDIHHFEDGEREYYIYANNEMYVCDKEEFIAQVSACFPSAKIKKVRGHWEFWGVGTNLSDRRASSH
jgi:prophage antirepressor-like protein